jgi:hypothetical protein
VRTLGALVAVLSVLAAATNARVLPAWTAPATLPTGTSSGYWLTSPQGQITAFGVAGSFGSVSGPVNAPIVGMSSTVAGKGYWLAGTDVGVFSFGDASFAGSMGGTHLNAPVVGITPEAPRRLSRGGVRRRRVHFRGRCGLCRLHGRYPPERSHGRDGQCHRRWLPDGGR